MIFLWLVFYVLPLVVCSGLLWEQRKREMRTYIDAFMLISLILVPVANIAIMFVLLFRSTSLTKRIDWK